MPQKLLSSAQQRYVTEGLARYVSPSEMIAAVAQNFGITLSPSAIAHYDPTTVQGRDLSRHLKELFYAARADSKNRINNSGLSHLAFRLEQMQFAYDEATERKNYRLRLRLLKAAAKEMGNHYIVLRQRPGPARTAERRPVERPVRRAPERPVRRSA